MQRRRWDIHAVTVLTVAAAVGAVALVAQAQSTGIIPLPIACLPAPLHLGPGVAHPGDEVVLSSDAAACHLAYPPAHTYQVVLQHRDVRTVPQRVEVAADGRFEAHITVPASFPTGDAVISVTGSPFDECDDDASCAGYWKQLVVE
ncbi:hypothetical protein [Leifsonia sp. AG29]|uniref:hypothetical protein n=1 Tax=Leifsonia sp. AG29 TaxID=2598860 RepID=UPI00131B4659|nr:hypothetical protein [Leifsonia sp. AG29]